MPAVPSLLSVHVPALPEYNYSGWHPTNLDCVTAARSCVVKSRRENEQVLGLLFNEHVHLSATVNPPERQTADTALSLESERQFCKGQCVFV